MAEKGKIEGQTLVSGEADQGTQSSGNQAASNPQFSAQGYGDGEKFQFKFGIKPIVQNFKFDNAPTKT